MADKKASSGDGKSQSAPRPLRSTLTALGVGLAWAAVHIPASLGDHAALAAWLVHALVAALVAKSALDLGGSVLTWAGKCSAALLRRVVG